MGVICYKKKSMCYFSKYKSSENLLTLHRYSLSRNLKNILTKMKTKKEMLKSGWRGVAAAVALSACLVIIAACNSNIDKALKLSERNRNELEKVLDHFKNSSYPLRYKAARFLIENMPSQYHEQGTSVDAFDFLYVRASSISQNNRTKFLESMLFAKDLSRVSMVYDISCMKADYLIKRINEACDLLRRGR